MKEINPKLDKEIRIKLKPEYNDNENRVPNSTDDDMYIINNSDSCFEVAAEFGAYIIKYKGLKIKFGFEDYGNMEITKEE